MKTLKRLFFLIAGISLLIACSKSDRFWDHDSFGDNSKNDQHESVKHFKHTPGTSYVLSGFALFDTWKVIDKTVLQDVHNVCTAELVFLEKDNFRITFFEVKPGFGTVPFECYGKISSSGVLTFKYPVPVFGTFNITDMIKMNSCATIWGEGINEGTLVFRGKFDGKRFTDTAKFMAKIEEYCPNNYMFETPVEGNLYWTFGHDLTVVED
jgi:hypothetical protein